MTATNEHVVEVRAPRMEASEPVRRDGSLPAADAGRDDYLPDELKGRVNYEPSGTGEET